MAEWRDGDGSNPWGNMGLPAALVGRNLAVGEKGNAKATLQTDYQSGGSVSGVLKSLGRPGEHLWPTAPGWERNL